MKKSGIFALVGFLAAAAAIAGAAYAIVKHMQLHSCKNGCCEDTFEDDFGEDCLCDDCCGYEDSEADGEEEDPQFAEYEEIKKDLQDAETACDDVDKL